MTELPLYPRASESRAQSLARKRDLLHPLAEEKPDAHRKAIQTLLVDCVFHTLRLTGEPVERREVEARRSDLVLGQFEALERLRSEAGRGRALTLDLLSEVHRLSSPSSAAGLRTGTGAAQFLQPPSRPELIREKVQNLFDWLAADSGRGMHPAERAALALARLLEVQPFEHGSFRTAHLLLSFFAAAEGYPPFFLRVEEADVVRSEIERAMVFDTWPLVERFSRALADSLDVCLAAVGAQAPRVLP